MSYKDQGTEWKFTIPSEGEVDSVETYQAHVREVDAALIDQDSKKQLLSRGTRSGKVVIDAYQTAQAGKDVYVTELHKHPTPTSVPQADHADEADHALEADHAKEADHAIEASQAVKLKTARKISDIWFDGTKDIVIPWVEHSTRADKLQPGANINSILFNGTTDITLYRIDIPDMRWTFWGTQPPTDVAGTLQTVTEHGRTRTLLPGDIYIRIE
jgi:hypothetical protein